MAMSGCDIWWQLLVVTSGGDDDDVKLLAAMKGSNSKSLVPGKYTTPGEFGLVAMSSGGDIDDYVHSDVNGDVGTRSGVGTSNGESGCNVWLLRLMMWIEC